MLKNKTNWRQTLTIDLKGSIWVSLFTLTILGKLVLVCFLESPDFTPGTLYVYGIVLGTFVAGKTVSKFVNGKNGQTVSED